MESLIPLFRPDHFYVGLFLVFTAGLIEYLLPPFPGDSLMLFGFFVAARGDLPVAGVFAAAFLGSAAGADAAYLLGGRMGRSYFFLRRSRFAAAALPALERSFSRYGDRLLLVNRFLPVLRGFFLYAAGMGGMPRGKASIYANLSNVAWILLIAWVGHRAGSSWDRLQEVFRGYAGFVGVVALIYVGTTLLRHRLRRKREIARGEGGGIP